MQDEARARFERGVELFDEHEYERSLLEFERAYTLAHGYRVLYNIAQVNVALGRYASAVKSLNRYLAEGAAEIAPARVEDVQRQLGEARSRTANLHVRVDTEGADISLDDHPLATSPMDSSELVDSGQHRILVRKRGFYEVARVVRLAGGDSVDVDVQLEAMALAERTVVVERPQTQMLPWIGWGTTGALAAGAAVFGLFALNSSSELDRLVHTEGTTQARRADQADTTATFATISTVLGGAALLAAGAAIYFTLRKPSGRTASLAQGTF